MALEMARLPGLAKSGLAMFGTKLIVQIIPSIAATVIGGYLLAQVHIGSSAPPDQPTQQTAPANAANDDQPTVREDRAAMRQVLRARRENPEPPATVKPKVAAVPAPAPVSTPAPLAPAMDSIAPNEPAAHAAAPARASVAVVPRPRPEVADYVPAPPPGLPAAPAVPPLVSQPTPITPVAPVARVAPAAPAAAAPNAASPVVQVAPVAPVVANATPVAPASPALPAPAVAPSGPQVVTALPDPATPAQEPPPRGPVGAVFSTLSSFVGHAANATGHTVNWVIDLPGKAIQAGGRVIGVDDPAPPSPPPPARPFS